MMGKQFFGLSTEIHLRSPVVQTGTCFISDDLHHIDAPFDNNGILFYWKNELIANLSALQESL